MLSTLILTCLDDEARPSKCDSFSGSRSTFPGDDQPAPILYCGSLYSRGCRQNNERVVNCVK